MSARAIAVSGAPSEPVLASSARAPVVPVDDWAGTAERAAAAVMVNSSKPRALGISMTSARARTPESARGGTSVSLPQTTMPIA